MKEQYHYKIVPLKENVEEMFIGPFGSSLKNDCFVHEDKAYCMVYEQKHAIQKTMNVETRYVDKDKYEELKRFSVRAGDIIVSCRGTIGETFVIPVDAPLGIMHPSIMKIRLKPEIYNIDYFNLLLQSRLKKHENAANGSGIKMAISAKELGNELFPVPTIKEQDFVNKVICNVKKIISKRREQLLELDQLVKSQFVEMFGDPNIEKRFEEVEFGYCTTGMLKGPFGSDMKKDLYVPKGQDTYKVYIQINAIQKDQTLGNYYISKEYFDKKICRFELKPGDYIVTCDGTLGKLLRLDKNMERGVISSSLLKITLDEEKIVQGYFESIWNMYMLGKMASQARNACLVHLPSAKSIGAFKIPLPPLDLQNKFDVFVKQVDKQKVIIQKSLDETQILFDSLMQKYFG